MRTQQKLRLAGLILVLLTPFLVAQQDDTPVVIMDGSLKIRSAVPWNQFTGGDTRSHPHGNKSVTSVDVTMNGSTQTVTFSNQPCTVDITYASAHIVFSSGNGGRGFEMRPFRVFRRGGDDNTLEHTDQNSKITHVTISRAGGAVVNADASGGTTITIHYR